MSICQFCGHKIELGFAPPELAMAVERVLKECAESHGVTMADIRGRRRYWNIVSARHCAMKRLRYELAMTLDAVALAVGRRHYSTVIGALDKHPTRPCCSAGYLLGRPRVPFKVGA